MEQEPVYVPSGKLLTLCEQVLGQIFDRRQTGAQQYVQARVAGYNAAIAESNKRRKWLGVFGVQPKMFITPVGMEMLIRAELESMPDPGLHPMVDIQREYGNLEHEVKDAMIACQYNDTVAISPNMTRAISHLGVSLACLARAPFGFANR